MIDQIKKIQKTLQAWIPEENKLGDSEYYIFDGKIVKKVGNRFGIEIMESSRNE